MPALRFVCCEHSGSGSWMSTRQMTLTLVLWLVICAIGIAGQCQPGKTPQEAGVYLPRQLNESFKADIAVFSVPEYAALSLHEHYSTESGRGSIHIEGPIDSYIFFLTEKDNIQAYGDKEGCRKSSKPSTISSWIQMTKKALNPDTVTFIERTTLMEIPVNHWRTCTPFSLNDGRQNLVAALDVFITNDDKWEMYTGTKDVLLRLSVDIFEENALVDNYFMDFLNFENIPYDANEFHADIEPPLGIPCLGLDQDLQQPQVPSSASFYRETVSRIGQQAYVSDSEQIIIDTEKQILQKQNSIVTHVRDFNHGASYLIMRIKGHSTTCYTMPVNTLGTPFPEDDTDSGFTVKDHYVTMDSVKDQLFLSGNFTYNGEYQYRGIPCDVFTHVTDNFGGRWQRASILLFFSKRGYIVADSGGLSQSKLVKIEIRVQDTPPTVHNILDLNEFDYDELLEAPYDLSPCFDEKHRIEFRLELEELNRKTQAALTAGERRTLEHNVRNLVAEICGLDFVRVHIGSAVETHGSISIAGKLFARPDSGVHFEHSVGKSFGSSEEALQRVVSTTKGVTDIGSCAQIAFYNPNVSDADFCQLHGICILYRKAASENETIALVQDDPCSHLTKLRGFADLTSISTAWGILEKKIFTDEMPTKVIVEDKIFKFSSIKRINDPEAKLHKMSTMNDFKKISPTISRKGDKRQLAGKVRLEECADQCKNSLLFPCEAFRYCTANSSCELYALLDGKETGDDTVGDRAPSYAVERNCEIYARSSLHNFERQPGTVARMASPSSGAELKGINGIDDCAELCMRREDFQCESFDFCSQGGSTGNCLLYKHHHREFSWSGEVEPEQNCSHFSKNYFWDYTKMDGLSKFPVSGSVMDSGGAAVCAFQCSSSADCNTFHYCETGDLCQYIDSSAGKPTTRDLEPTYRCYTFVQKDIPDVTSRHKKLVDKVERTGVSGGGYSIGAMAALAVAMLVLGVFLCFVGLYSWTSFSKQRSQSKDNWEQTLDMDDPASTTENSV
ncbi:hypothetical protein EGW08_005953 [Elysia chlorotica]|uniref:Apple domain-containing protein n=1 Tax=Elysia chlorotica TaxID=188477 RepID=A0A433TXC9_ELYCH|nr:hypothetical protein EGW08_005953 [Elysia chlorotica]